MKERNQVCDLRSALDRLRAMPRQLVETDVPVDPAAELAGVYRHVGAGGTVMRPTRSGPAMIFNQIKGHPGARVAIGLLADRKGVAALLAFSAFSELKHIFLEDEDVDPFDRSDVLWAMNTRFQGDTDILTIPGVRCQPLDPSNDPTCSNSIRDHGIACKTVFDCTVPFDQKARFCRARFLDVDPAHWVPELFPKD